MISGYAEFSVCLQLTLTTLVTMLGALNQSMGVFKTSAMTWQTLVSI